MSVSAPITDEDPPIHSPSLAALSPRLAHVRNRSDGSERGSPAFNPRKRASPRFTPDSPRKRREAMSPAIAPITLATATSTASAPTSPAVAPAAPPSPRPQPPPQPHHQDPGIKTLPKLYQSTATQDLVILISDMLGELVGLNDCIPLSGAGLTRFHSRAPPTISITDYLNRLSIHASLQPSILLSMVYYIDILSTHYPPFVVSSLTVHRFLITAATVASKGLCDTFLTNTFYAKVGGLSLMELNMLELEFLVRVGWRIVPKAEVLEDYYRSLVMRMGGRYRVEDDEGG